MSDTASNFFNGKGTAAEMAAFTPNPATPAVGNDQGYTFFNEDDGLLYSWDGATWVAGSGNVATGVTLTAGKTIIGAGTTAVDVSSLTAQFVGSSSGTAAAASMTTNRLLGRTTASSGAVEEITPGASLKFAAGALDGRVVQVVNFPTGAVATGSTQIPRDDTIPQNTEGDEYMTLAVTPTSSTNKLKIEVVINLSINQTGRSMIAALFQDTTANALAAASARVEVSTAISQIVFTHYMTAGTTSSTTFKVRAGASDTGTTTFNGASGGRIFGGVMASSITITEITV